MTKLHLTLKLDSKNHKQNSDKFCIGSDCWFDSYKYKILNDFKIKWVSAQYYLALCDRMDCSPKSSSVHGIFLAIL